MTDYIKCQCGKENTSGEVFCPDCGALLRNGSLLGKRFKLIKRSENKEVGWLKYKAFDRNTQRNLCLNVLVKDDENIRSCFKAWANKVKELVHPNIVSVFGFYTDELLQKSFISMEDVVERKTLLELLMDKSKFSQEEATRYILNICDALSYAHAKGMYHGDIRPGNLIIGGNGQMRLINFSLAQNLKRANIPVGDFIPGKVYKTPANIKEEIDDVYKLGLLMSEMLSASFSQPNPETFVISYKDGEVYHDFRFSWAKESKGDGLLINQFRNSLQRIGQELVKCRTCGFENAKEYPFCELCGDALKEKLTLGNYELEKRLIKENLLVGIKYLALDKSQKNKRVTIYIFPDYIYKPEITNAVRDWYDSVKDLQDKRVVKVFGFFDDFSKKCKYLIKEYLEEWPSIKESLSNGKKFSEEEIIDYALEICKALSYAHSKSILHLDLRPENIILKPGNGIMLDNFRLAWVVKQKKLWHLPTSVKQYEVSEAVQRSDIYQLGLVLYEMINNSLFDPNKGFVFPDRFNEYLMNLVKKMLDKSQSTRYFNIVELERAVADLKQSL